MVLPQAATGIASTAIFCLIFAWNEYAFAVLADLAARRRPRRRSFPRSSAFGGLGLARRRRGATIFLVPVMVFTILLRKHLLRGITFGAVRK